MAAFIANATWWGTLSGDTCVSSPISPTTASLAPHSWLENAIPQTNLDYWYVNRRNEKSEHAKLH